MRTVSTIVVLRIDRIRRKTYTGTKDERVKEISDEGHGQQYLHELRGSRRADNLPGRQASIEGNHSFTIELPYHGQEELPPMPPPSAAPEAQLGSVLSYSLVP